MDVTLRFTLPEDREELNAALQGQANEVRIESLYNDVFRPHIKYGTPILLEQESLTEEQYEVLQALWEKIVEHFEL